jgi:putative hydrolase of the HAD superfamily
VTLKAVLFDLDDTLYDHRHSCRCALEAIRESLPALWPVSVGELETGHNALLDKYHAGVLAGSLTLDEARLARFSELLGGYGMIDPVVVASTVRLYRETYVRSEQLVDGALAALDGLRAAGFRLGLVTNNTVAEQMGKLERLGLLPRFDALAISEAVGVAKPDPRIFAHTLERLGVPAAEAVMVGDSWSADVLGAQAAGIRAVWLNRYGRACPDASLAREIMALDALLPLASVPLSG